MVDEALEMLKDSADPESLAGMERYGITLDNRLGVKVPEIRRIAKELGKDHELALDLWKTGLPEAMILASMVDEVNELTVDQMDSWVGDFNSWDVCDQVCMNLFDKSPFAWNRITAWHTRSEEYVKRAAYALIASLALHDKNALDEQFLDLMPLVREGAFDDRNFVKKAVSWALRNIGKRNKNLYKAAYATAQELLKSESVSARWIGRDTIKDITSQAATRRLERKENQT